jgi:hypothetical protein
MFPVFGNENSATSLSPLPSILPAITVPDHKERTSANWLRKSTKVSRHSPTLKKFTFVTAEPTGRENHN